MSVVLPVNPGSPADLDGPAGVQAAVPEQTRVCIHVGNFFVDTSLAMHAPISVVMDGLVPYLAATLRGEGLAVDFKTNGVYSLAVEGGMAFPRTQTLAEVGVYDGARLLLREVRSAEVFKPIIEDGSDALAEFNAVKFPAFSAATAHALGLIAMVAGSGLLAALFIAAWWSTPGLQWWLPLVGPMMLVALGGSIVAGRRGAPQLSWTLGMCAPLLAAATGWVLVPPFDSVPGHASAANVLAAVFAAGAVSLLVAWLTGLGITVHTAVVTATAAAAVVAALRAFTGFDARQLGTAALVVGMIVVAAAPASALILARVRPPSLPPPGEALDRKELEEAAMAVEVFDDLDQMRTVALSDDEDTQLERRSRVANKYLTGLFAAAVVIAVTGAVCALKPGTHYFYGELALAIVAAVIFALRGRSLTDRVQALMFFAAAFALVVGISLVVIIESASALASLITIVVLAILTVAAALVGLVVPGLKLSPITLRRIEQLEFLVILSIPPLAGWVMGVYAALRNLL